ncbi:MAG TPA: CBS domain-containing protein [Gemmataceae bacterium]|nr:CBS domain-containing protein [Gemmataceae bacterium]
MQTTQALFDLIASDLMSRQVITIPQETSLPVAVERLAQAHVSDAPVVDSGGRCIGLFSTANLARRAQLAKRAAQQAPAIPGCVCSDWGVVEHDWDTLPAEAVSWYMTADPATVSAETPICELAKKMTDGHFCRLIVVDAERHPVGIVACADVLAALARSTVE